MRPNSTEALRSSGSVPHESKETYGCNSNEEWLPAPHRQASASGGEAGRKDVRSVYGLIRTGKIRARKVGNTFLVNLTSVREFAGEE